MDWRSNVFLHALQRNTYIGPLLDENAFRRELLDRSERDCAVDSATGTGPVAVSSIT